jgi:hypothetical protein
MEKFNSNFTCNPWQNKVSKIGGNQPIFGGLDGSEFRNPPVFARI